MKIYPKISSLNNGENMKKILEKTEGIEIQFFDEKSIAEEFNFEKLVRETKREYPQLKEIVVHPPLSDYNIELIIFKDKKIVENQLRTLVNLSKELNIELDIIYHTYWTKPQFITTGLADDIKDLLKIIENTKVTLLLENLFMMLDERIGCSALEVCKHINHPNLKFCLDTTHVHCKANIWKEDFKEQVQIDFNKEDCVKYTKQIHFAATLNNDGYSAKSATHGRVHPSIEEVKEELKWLENIGLKDKNYVTEVSEEDYYIRPDQVKEIEMLEEAYK